MREVRPFLLVSAGLNSDSSLELDGYPARLTSLSFNEVPPTRNICERNHIPNYTRSTHTPRDHGWVRRSDGAMWVFGTVPPPEMIPPANEIREPKSKKKVEEEK